MNYPNGIKKSNPKNVDYSNRGMALEDDINKTNEYYLINNIAVIHKKPTPITIKKVDFIAKNKIKIKDAYFQKPSTTDYNGIYKERYIDFEAKETTAKKSFPLTNIHQHQIKHLIKIIEHGGIGFLIVRFKAYNETYYLDGKDFKNFLETKTRKSIPYSYFKNHGYLIPLKFQPRMDYIKIINKLYFKGDDVL